MPYPWTTWSINYLGITLTSPRTDLYKATYIPLITTIEQEKSSIQKYFLSWCGLLAAYKILLPKKYFYFRALPIPIPTSFFTTMQKQMLHFIWAEGKARCSPQTQWKHKSVVGMGIPVFKDYYVAAVLDQLKNWFDRTNLKPEFCLDARQISVIPAYGF